MKKARRVISGILLVSLLPVMALAQSKLVNISTRGLVGTVDDVMIGGFIIEGNTPKTVLVRARGPTLADFEVPGVLANPSLQLFSQQTTPSTLIAENDNWKDTQEAAIIATGLDPCQPLFDPGGPAPTGCTLESAILITLDPGAYTAIVRGVGGGTGVGLVEIFETDVAAPPPLDLSGNYVVTVTVTSTDCPGVVPGDQFVIPVTVSQTGQNLIFTDPTGFSLTGTLTGTSFTVTGTFSEPVPGTSCVLTDTITLNGTVNPATLNFSGTATESIVGNSPTLCFGFVSCTANETLVGTRVSALQFQELQAALEAAGFRQLLWRLEIP